jgi:hypothetical protein
MADIFTKLRSFSHSEYSEGQYADPNYIYARIACGYGVLPERWQMPEKLQLTKFDSRIIFVPDDPRFDFLKARIGFRDLDEFPLSKVEIMGHVPPGCPIDIDSETIGVLH